MQHRRCVTFNLLTIRHFFYLFSPGSKNKYVNISRPDFVPAVRLKNEISHCETVTYRVIGRNEATRTPDPYVPNVVRYQLRYIPIAFEKWCHQESNLLLRLILIP